ncbi:MAG: ABC transporter permease [Oscillospiraceae bacterium]|nr:ABC transporter permease [Oscillospiraceae bacterium]
MNSVKSIFKKQIKDIYSNQATLMQFIVFPAVAFAMTHFVARSYGFDGPETMFITMMSAAFVGMALVPFVAGIIAEDRETKSLRFLVMAGVKPLSYLLGIGGVVFFVSLFPAVAFALMGRLSGQQVGLFMAIFMSGVIASILLGLTIGIFAKNQQAATGLAMPIAMLLGTGPMVAPFNETIGRVFNIFYTQQLNVVMNSFHVVDGYQPDVNLVESFTIIGANIAVLVVLFVVAFVKKGLKG